MLYRSPHDFPEFRHFPRRAREKVLSRCGSEAVGVGVIVGVLPVAVAALVLPVAAASYVKPALGGGGAVLVFGMGVLATAFTTYQFGLRLFRRRVREHIAPFSHEGELLKCLECEQVLDMPPQALPEGRCPRCGSRVYRQPDNPWL